MCVAKSVTEHLGDKPPPSKKPFLIISANSHFLFSQQLLSGSSPEPLILTLNH